jgi:hypothetical protein
MRTKEQIVASYVAHYGNTPEYWADKLQKYWNKTPKSPFYEKKEKPQKPKKQKTLEALRDRLVSNR